MKYPVRLFLGNEEVEFSNPPDILFNYSETELTNPTIVKNAYSKTITIEGTKNNNQIFGHIYDMQRIQGFSGSVMGSAFNPLVKTDFTLYYNGSVYESGYFKLDEVRRNDNNIEYDISLFGGLGDYFYNLSFREDGTPMELSDLKYEWEVNNNQELGFKINKEAVAEAWLYMSQPSSKWDTINFAPCYNGVPTNISADKFLISKGVYPFPNSASGYCLGTSEHEHTEWETFDLRSYLQRPVLRVREVLKACADPRNNGGYTVNLDSDFFNTNNPYYQDSWVTLPMLPDLDVPETVSSALTISAITHESDALYKLWDGGANATNVQVDVNVNFTPSGSYSGDSVYLFKDYKANGGVTLQSRFAKSFWADSAILVQMLGYNASGQISTVSNVFRLVTPPEGEYSVKTMPEWMRKKFEKANPATDITGISNVIGKFTKKNGQFVFTDLDGNTQTLRFTFPSDAVFTKLKLKILPQYSYSLKRTFNSRSTTGHGLEELNFWSSRYRHSNSWQDEAIVRKLDKVDGSVSYSPVGATGTTTSFEGFFSNRTYSKRDLLTLGVSPAQFLLSYAKAFGLYFIKDVEKKEISILSRHNFYKRDEIVNINDLIDKGSDIKIIPNSPKYQYYDFAFEQVDSEAAEAYRKTYGNEYGTATVNTGYQYEKEHKALLDGNIFKGGVTVMEKNKYFFKPVQGTPWLIWNGFSYTYVNVQGQNVEKKIKSEPMHGTIINPDGLKYYDYMAKLQFHNANNEASDGSMVLVFCDNAISGAESCGYKLTDDVPEMYTLNDGQPCWLMVSGTTDASGNTIAVVPRRIPHFTRDIYNYHHIIENSFDMGTPLTTYVPNSFVSDWQSIYSKSWKSYISDLYDVNTRVLRCRCLLRERPNPDWMRRFYWFDNSYWRLNEIKDWDISSFGTTEMEFIKVQDINNYDNVLFSNCPIVEDRFEQHFIDYTGGTITGIIYVSDGSSLAIGAEGVTVRYSDGTKEVWDPQGVIDPIYTSGVVNVRVNVTIPANTSNYTRTITLQVKDTCDQSHYITLTQGIEEHNATITPTTISFTDMGGTRTLTISDPSNHGWTVGSASNWITLSQTGGTGSTTVTVTAAANPSSTGRDTSITFRDANTSISTDITVTQAANIDATVYPTGPVNTGESGGTAYFTITDPSNHGWTFNNTGTSWIHVSPSAGTGSDSAVVTFDRNETGDGRSSIMVFSDIRNGTTTKISVYQEAHSAAAYIVPTGPVSVNESGGTAYFTITDPSNHGWTFNNTGTSWIHVSPSAGTGSDSAVVTFDRNETGDGRSSIMVFSDIRNGTTTKISVYQEAHSAAAYIVPTSADYPGSGDTKTFDIYDQYEVGWEFSNIPSWLLLSYKKGVGSMTITAQVDENTTQSARSATIIFTSNGEEIPVYFSQAANLPATIQPTGQVNIGSTGGTRTFTISDPSNHGWSFNNTGTSWITIAPSAGTGDATVTVTFSGNTASSSRTSIMVFSDITQSGTTTIPVYQEAYQAVLADYLKLEIVSGGTLRYYTSSSSYTKPISFSKDDGTTWTTISAQTGGRDIAVSVGDKILFKGTNNGYGMYPTLSAYTNIRGTAKFNLSGNILSLIYGDNFEGQTTVPSEYQFHMFFKDSGVVNASGLTLPSVVKTSCYRRMFEGCGSLVSAPALPATTLAQDCYEGMFIGCTNLAAAPALPATALENMCYYGMFYNCISLTSAPVLPATTLPVSCYGYMFQNCSSLNYIKCLATNLVDSSTTSGWTTAVASTGTFVKDAEMTGWTLNSANGIPRGWTVIDYGITPARITPSSLSFASSGGSASFIVTDSSNAGWKITNTPSWTTFSSTQGTGTTVVSVTASTNTSTSQRSVSNIRFYSNGETTLLTITQAAGSPSFSCLLNFTYGDVTAPQTATWDEYNIYYNMTGGNPVEDERLMMSISCGTILYQGTTWNPTISSYYSVSSPFVDAGSVSQIEVPQSLAGQTIYLKVEFGSAEAGYAIYSELVTVQIPSSGGTVNVTIPKF